MKWLVFNSDGGWGTFDAPTADAAIAAAVKWDKDHNIQGGKWIRARPDNNNADNAFVDACLSDIMGFNR